MHKLSISKRTATITAASLVLLALAYVQTQRSRRKQQQHIAEPEMSKEEIYALRKKHMCAAQSISYENSNPLLIVRGEKEYLYDETGAEYLDTRNNVGHIGHSHPAVAEAVSRQIALINTNTRYLHPNIVRLAQRLLATIPENKSGGPRLSVCFFVNSGSEANDLALRLAFAYTKHTDAIVVEGAYHGNTIGAISLSPYKFDGPKGTGKPDWVHKVPCPDVYRGIHRTASWAAGVVVSDRAKREELDRLGNLYAATVDEVCVHVAEQYDQQTKKGGAAAFFMESGMSVAGVIQPPPNYLRKVYASVRAVGGVCVADEVQVAFGRYGTHFWGFDREGDGAYPDIVTVGKPFGNGMPLACVITTEPIARSFAQGKEYFNTFGGNPVACAAGLAVLDVIEREKLQSHALSVGTYLRRQLEELKSQFEVIGDIRGCGLFLGIDFVREQVNRTAAPEVASWLCSRLKSQHRVLTSIDGPLDNVIVIKPPMCFSQSSADIFVSALRQELNLLRQTPLPTNISHTPT